VIFGELGFFEVGDVLAKGSLKAWGETTDEQFSLAARAAYQIIIYCSLGIICYLYKATWLPNSLLLIDTSAWASTFQVFSMIKMEGPFQTFELFETGFPASV